MKEWVDTMHYYVPILFSKEDRMIFVLVLLMVAVLPVLLCVLHFKPLVRGTALIIFAIYILGNLSFTILGREGIYASQLPAFGNYRQAFYLDLGLEGTLQMLPEGIGQTLRHIHIGNYTAAREVFLNILLYIPMAQSAEEIFQILLEATETGEVGLWVLDSVPCLVSENDLEKKLTDAQRVAGISGILTAFLRRIVGPCVKNECTGIFINQIRDKINSPVPGVSTPGGRALRHYCTIRMEFRKGSYLDENGKTLSRSSGSPESQQIMVNMVKTKSCRPSRHVGYYTINYDDGIDYLADLIEIALMYDIVDQKGAWFSIIDTETGEVLKDKIQGQANLSRFLDENPEITERVEQLVEQAME